MYMLRVLALLLYATAAHATIWTCKERDMVVFQSFPCEEPHQATLDVVQLQPYVMYDPPPVRQRAPAIPSGGSSFGGVCTTNADCRTRGTKCYGGEKKGGGTCY